MATKTTTKTEVKKAEAAAKSTQPAADVKTEVSKSAKTEAVKADAKKLEEKKETVKKEAAKKEPAKKTAPKKTTTTKKTTSAQTEEKKTAPKKTTVKKETAKTSLTVQFSGKDIDADKLEKDIIDKYVAETGKKASTIKELRIYVKPADYRAYYVINNDEHVSSIEL